MIIHTAIKLPVGIRIYPGRSVNGTDYALHNSITDKDNKVVNDVTFIVLREATREEYFKQLEEMNIEVVSDELEPYIYEIAID